MNILLCLISIDFQYMQVIIHDLKNILKSEYDIHLRASSIVIFSFKHLYISMELIIGCA